MTLIEDASSKVREALVPIVDQSFQGIYRWHARHTLRSVSWVRKAVREGTPVGLTMSAMIAADCGYLFYVAVVPAARSAGIGGLLLDDVLHLLHAKGAREVFACVRPENRASVRLLESRSFTGTSFGDLARSRGLGAAVNLWLRMVVAPGEKVLRTSLT